MQTPPEGRGDCVHFTVYDDTAAFVWSKGFRLRAKEKAARGEPCENSTGKLPHDTASPLNARKRFAGCGGVELGEGYLSGGQQFLNGAADVLHSRFRIRKIDPDGGAVNSREE